MLSYAGHTKELYGGPGTTTTNQRMELTAAIEALSALTRPCTVTLYTDSRYLIGGATSWMAGWKANGWTRSGGVIKNLDLWRRLDVAMEPHKIKWTWVKGHSGVPGNVRADKLANMGADGLSHDTP